ncbi:Gfo/Idh/MocA family protein [Alginatibacterium sediminis]|nr:Gfo/Idh/MocA family oxidoreductase [Alginatibacterium sediminis]
MQKVKGDAMLGIGIIGCGNISRMHADAISTINNATLVAVSSRSEHKAEQLANRMNCDYHLDYHQLLSRSDITIVMICTPNQTHLQIALDAVAAGKHIIVEKPLANNLADVDTMINACKKAKLKLTSIFQHRFNPAMLKLKQAVDDGLLGRINFGGCYEKIYRGDSYFESSPGRGTWAGDGGGVVIMNAIHYIDSLQFIMGPAVEVFSYAATLAHDDIEVEDVSSSVIKFANGALGTIEASSAAFPKLHSRLEINGDKGSVVIENHRLKEWRIQDNDMQLHPLYGDLINQGQYANKGAQLEPSLRPNVVAEQINDFVLAVLHDRAPYVSADSARHSLAIVYAIYESAKTGKAVKLGQ